MPVPVFAAGILTTFFTALPAVVIWILTRLGIGIVSYAGLQLVLEQFYQLFTQAFSGVPTDIINLISFLGVGQFISIVLSALSIKFAVMGMARIGLINR